MKRLVGIGIAVATALALSVVAQADSYPNGTYHSAQANADLPVVKVTVNGSAVSSPVPGVILDGSTMLPVRAVAQALGAQVQWDPSTYTAALDTQQAGVPTSAWLDVWKREATDISTTADAVVADAKAQPSDQVVSDLNQRATEIGDDIAALGEASAPTKYSVLDTATAMLGSAAAIYAEALVAWDEESMAGTNTFSPGPDGFSATTMITVDAANLQTVLQSFKNAATAAGVGAG